jgi:hypothetical protein
MPVSVASSFAGYSLACNTLGKAGCDGAGDPWTDVGGTGQTGEPSGAIGTM